ncbi:hypothetical protein BGX24_002073 [Mortierella sp. AD032]|nr:hypothetical protein BGX24_002073 [Mortierella sp. AD032]
MQPFVGDHHHFRGQGQDYLHGTDSKNDDEYIQENEEDEEDEDVWEDDEYVDDDDDGWGDGDESEPDPVYVADLLRQSGIDWMQYPEYATHRLVVTSTTTTGEEEEEARQYYRVMAQFLVPASAVFRDFLHGMTLSSDDDGDEERQEFHKARLACLQDGPLDPTLGNNDAFLNPSNPPAPELTHSLLEPLTPYIHRRYAPYEPNNPHQPLQQADANPLAHQPWIHLTLPHPSHFPGLLQAIYTMDLRQWEEICFRPETIAAITAMVSRLECSSVLTVCCLEYYRKIKAILGGVEEFEELQSGAGHGGEVEELKRLYKAAVESGMLPPDHDL